MKSPLLRLALTFLICLISNTICGQFHRISDSLTAPTAAWSGDTAWMNFSSEGLRSAAPSAGSLTWRRPSLAGLGGQWRLGVTMDFNPSSSNYCEFRFLENNGNYYAIQLGGTSSDHLSLVLHTTYKDSVLASIPEYVDESKPELALKILRDTSAKFEVYDADTLLFSCTDSTLMRSESLSIYARYTSSRVDKFLFSTLLAEGYDFPDTLGPKILKSDVIDPFTLEIEWDEWCQTAGSTNAFLLSDGTFLDTLTITNHYDQIWHAENTRPLPQGTFEILLPLAEDAEHNLSFGATTSLYIHYPGAKSCWITAVHPFENYGGHFIGLQSELAIENAVLTVLEKDGDTKAYSLDIDSGLSRFSALKLPEEAVLIIEKDGIVLTLQPYKHNFESHQELGDFLLTADSLTGLSNQFQPAPLSTYTPQWKTPGSLPYQGPIAFFTDTQGHCFAHFSHSLWPYMSLKSSAELQSYYDPLRSFLLPTGIPLPKPLGDTTVLFKPVQWPDTSLIHLSEVHFNPDSLEEFIELHNPQPFPVAVHELQLRKVPITGWVDVDLIDPDVAPFNAKETLFPLLLPDQFLAIPTPFSLPNQRTALVLIGPFGKRIDAMTYAPWDDPLYDKHSAERISFLTSGADSLNWSPHHFNHANPSEASPNAPNSVAHFNLLQPNFNIELFQPNISYDPLNFSPTALLRLRVAAGAELSLSVHTASGRPIAFPMEKQPLSEGLQQVEIRPFDWHGRAPQSGVYLLKVSVKDHNGRTQKILPLSVYNP
ncbi:MAG: hypothetical protein ACPG9M_05050 [Schleiferiaceae bacterium]